MWSIYTWPFFIVCILVAFGQLCGISAFLYYGPEVIKQTDADVPHIEEKNESADILDNFIVVSFVLGNLISAILIYSLGRKTIVYCSLPFAVLSGYALAYCMYEANYGDDDEPDNDLKQAYRHYDR